MYNLYRSPNGMSGSLSKRVIDSNERMKEIQKRNAEKNAFKPGINVSKEPEEIPEERIPSGEDALFEDRDSSALFEDNGEETFQDKAYDNADSEFVPGLNAEELSPDSLHDSLGDETAEYSKDPYADSQESYYGEEEPGMQYDDAQHKLSDEEVMASLRERAMQYIEEVKEQAKRESDSLYQEAYNKALNDARQAFEVEKAEALDSINAKRQNLEEEYNARFTSMESELVPTLLSVFDEVLGVGIKDYSDIIFYLIKKTILGMESPKQIVIKVSKDNFDYIKESIDDIRELVGADVSIDVLREESFTEKDCKIENEYGIFDCGFDTELNGLKKKILMLSKNN